MNRLTREENIAKFKEQIASGKILVGVGAGTGITAKSSEAGGADILIIYNSGRYRMAGRGSLAGLLSYGDANQIVVEMGAEVLPVVKETPVLAGVCGTDPFRVMDIYLQQLKDQGFSGVQNFPTVGLIDGVFRQNLEEFSELMEMEQLLGTPERQLSLGQKMKCNIAAAFLHDPEIVYLDEPTIGLDSESKYKIRKFIQRMNEERRTTFLVTSHDFQDIESLCRRMILINHGKLVLDDKIEHVRKILNRRKQIRLELEHNPWNQKTVFEIPGVGILHSQESELILEFDMEENDSISIINFISERARILDVSINGQDIESIIRDIVKRDNGK